MAWWKPLLIVLPAGMALGVLGGHFARPVMTQRAVGDQEQAMFQTRAERYGVSAPDAVQSEGGSGYVGGYSYPPVSTPANAGWAPPHEYAYADLPLPSLAQLDARQAALLADPDVQYAVPRPGSVEQAAEAGDDAGAASRAAQPATGAVASAADLPLPPEPRKADGEPAIW